MKQSCKIPNLTQIVDDTAFRANLFALHAAIESAGGAENGAACELAGDEIRRLAKCGVGAADGIPQDETKTF